MGGAKVSDPSADLAAALAVASAAMNVPVPQRLVALGEVGLAGELRAVPAPNGAWPKRPDSVSLRR